MDFDKSLYTPTGFQIIEMAREIAMQMGFNYFGVEHLLLAICHHKETQEKFRISFDFNPLAIHELVVRTYHLDSEDSPAVISHKTATPTLRLRNVLNIAHECLPLMRRNNINEEALLLGILKEDGSDAAKILNSMNITYANLLPKFQNFTRLTSSRHTAKTLGHR
jgi:ATP-dependent Clp protease ATP-binding subunit ClpA